MADVTYSVLNGVSKKLKDMGDGTHAEVVYPSTSGGSGPAAPTPITGSPVTTVDRSGTITAGGTAQALMAANAHRAGFWIQNVSDGDLWINDLGAAVVGQPSLLIPSGGLYEPQMSGVPAGAISIIGATTAQAYSAREW